MHARATAACSIFILKTRGRGFYFRKTSLFERNCFHAKLTRRKRRAFANIYMLIASNIAICGV